MAIDKKAILKDNQDLRQRMSKEAWKVTYDKKSDTLIFGSKFPKNSGNIYINEKEGSMVRVGEDNKIYGDVIFLNTENGEKAKDLIENKNFQFGIRSVGVFADEIVLKSIFTWDIIENKQI